MGAADAMFGDGAMTQLMLIMSLSFLSAVAGAFLPMRCRLDDRGIHFQSQVFPWETVRRWNVNDRRLQLVAARSTNRQLLYTMVIPLDGLSPALVPWLAEQLTAHATGNQEVGSANY